MEKIKILIVGMSSNLGGIETYLYNLVKNADLNKYEFDFLYPKLDEMTLEKEIESLGCRIYKLTPRYKNMRKHIKEVKNVLKNNYDFIHCNVMDYSWFEPIVIANKYSNSKIIIHSHNGGFNSNFNLKKKILHKIGGSFIKNINFYKVACGKRAGDFMFSSSDFQIFNNGINLDTFSYSTKNRNEIRKEFNIKNNTTIIGLVARLEEQKNPLFLLDIFNDYHKLNNNSCLMVVGEGSLKDKIIEKAKEYNIDNCLYLVGKRFDANKFYSAYDILVMPSLYEGLSITLIEAQANGLKCYTSDTVDAKSDVTGNVEFLSLNKNSKEWAKYIYNNDNNRDSDIEKKIPEEYNSKKSYKKVFDFYKDNL